MFAGVISDLYSHHEAHEAEHALRDSLLMAAGVTDPPPAPTNPPVNEALSTILLVMASSNRPDYLKKTLHFVSEYHPKYASLSPHPSALAMI
jgi:hypothetical protein